MKVSFKNNTKTLFLVLFIMLSLCLVGCSQKEKGLEDHSPKTQNYVAERLSNSEGSSDLENILNAPDLYFTKNYYATIYKPARCLYDSDKDYEEDLKLYDKYLKAVGSLDNTFEERFRGNVQIKTSISRNQSKKQVIVTPYTTISVYSEEARNYLINTVLPEMGEDGINIKLKIGYRTYDLRHDYERAALLEDLDYQAYKKYNVYDNSNKLPSVQWDLEVPQELVDIYGEYYKKYFNNANSPLTNNPFMQDKDFRDLSQIYYSFVEADEYLVIYDQYQFQMPLEHIYKELYRLLYSTEQKVETVIYSSGIVEYGYYIEKNGELVPYTSSGFVAKDSKGKYIYDEEGFVTRKLYSMEQVEYDKLVIEGKLSSGSSDSGSSCTGFNVTAYFNILTMFALIIVIRKFLVIKK